MYILNISVCISASFQTYNHLADAVPCHISLQDAASLGVAGENSRLCGARIQTYLLEKAGRVG